MGGSACVDRQQDSDSRQSRRLLRLGGERQGEERTNDDQEGPSSNAVHAFLPVKTH